MNENDVIETEAANFDEFLNEFSDGNQTEETTSEEVETGAEESQEETQVEDETGDEVTEEDPVDGAEEGDGTQPKEDAPKDETFTLKVNHQEKSYSRDEVVALAQKGADYDRVKGQMSQLQTDNQSLRDQISGMEKYKDAIDLLEKATKSNGQSIDDFVRNVRINLKVKAGMSAKEAQLEVRAEDAERKAAAGAEVKKTPDSKAKDQIADFQRKYPKVTVDEALLEKLQDDIVTKNCTLTEAYENMVEAERQSELAAKDAKIKELEAQIKANKKNAKNKATSPGSMASAGGQHGGDSFDAFNAFLRGK